ncbi:MAG: tRNA (guanosine(46)-N7)-methyltransferase TrmB [Muribaculaceae bacterium]|nr:tRNA (guanosine(46)-N7)-methyltransferase TrmB [Muribaculaceae bacterium]MDE5929055.1 tRNA (guanosine(46)-N7)-methyltransferase TrmB [Muribaculaceae bacterium]MDE6131549.1 tRNA (guanosine(46)-N7)-methyltransferase TrmB [Muribaculaceae bacterium]
MGKNKLKKFADMKQIGFVYEYPFARLEQEGFPLRGHWGEEVFGNSNPITLELGCGKGEYTVGLARRFPDRNFIGIDIKGARMWSGATEAQREGLKNVAFLRTSIELLDRFFAPDEVDSIWITFPDPQMKKVRKRLTSTRFMELYRKVLRPGGMINLKTDSPFLYTYTREMVALNRLPVDGDSSDLYAETQLQGPLTEIRTHYERQWLSRGLTIKYISFRLPAEGALAEPETEIEHDTYRSYSRGYIECPQLLNDNKK